MKLHSLLLTTFVAGCLFATPTPAKAQSGRQWAILIGIERYQKASPLRHTINDVEQLATTLEQRGGYARENLLKITETQTNPRMQPLRESLLAVLPEFFAKPGPSDQILVYFSGHGFRDKEGKLFLAPIDCDPANPEPTGIAVEWLRDQLAGCRAKFKLLVLDACHAGSEKGDNRPSVSAKDMGVVFRDIEGVVTLASSTENEQSQIWEAKQQSLFTYWLNAGLKGHADDNSNGEVTIDELYEYVYRNVTHSAEVLFPRKQTPVRIVRSGTLGVPAVVRLQPQPLQTVLGDMAEQLAWSLEERKVNKVGVLEFTNDTRLGELLGADFGLLGRYCAEELEKRLMKLGQSKFSVVDRRRLQSALQSQGFKLGDLGSPEALRRLSDNSGGMPVIALGTLSNRVTRSVTLRAKLIQTTSDDVAGAAGGSAVLNESEWAMLGRSVAVKPEDRRPSFRPAPGNQLVSLDEQVIRRLDERSEGSHPLVDPSFPFRLKIMVGGKERAGVVRGNEYYVPLTKGEVYEIWIENRSGQLSLMRLLVDGLNTLPEKEVVDGVERLYTAKRVNLDVARPWLMDPKQANVFAVRGFFEKTGKAAPGFDFKVVDASESVAARQRFTDQIGLITAAFYAPGSGSRSIGTGFGDRRVEDLEERKAEVGPLLAVVHIRYLEPAALRQLTGR